MDRAFVQSRDTVAAAERGWKGEAEFQDLRDRAKKLGDEAAALKCAPPAPLAQVEAALAAAAQATDADPLNAAEAARDAATMLDAADRALAAARQDQGDADAFLRGAEERLAALAECFAAVEATRARRLARIADPPPAAALPADPSPALREWLGRLSAAIAGGRARAGVIGAKSWTAQAELDAATLRRTLAEDQRLLDARDDLRGHFSALKARADTLAAQGRLTDEASRLVAETAGLLFGRPTPLPEAVRLIRRCDQIRFEPVMSIVPVTFQHCAACGGKVVEGACEDCGRVPSGGDLIGVQPSAGMTRSSSSRRTSGRTVASSIKVTVASGAPRLGPRQRHPRLDQPAAGAGRRPRLAAAAAEPGAALAADGRTQRAPAKARLPKCGKAAPRDKGFCTGCGAQYNFLPALKADDLVAGQYRVAGPIALRLRRAGSSRQGTGRRAVGGADIAGELIEGGGNS